MNTFLRRIAVFWILVLAVIGAAEVYVEHLSHPSRIKHEWLKRHSAEVRTLVLGNSHTFYRIPPSELNDSAFSLAQVSQTYRYDDYLLCHYDFPNLEQIILPFSYMSLWEDFETQTDKRFNAVRYRLYMNCDIHSRFSQYGLECLHIAPFKEKLKSLYNPSLLSCDSLGWGNNYEGHRLTDWDNGAQRAKENTYSDASLVSLNTHFLRNILSNCRTHHVKVMLVTMPVSPNYYKNEDIQQRRVNETVIAHILKEYPDITYLNLERDKRFNSADFYDADHLNTRGAHKCASILRQYIESPSAISKSSHP